MATIILADLSPELQAAIVELATAMRGGLVTEQRIAAICDQRIAAAIEGLHEVAFVSTPPTVNEPPVAPVEEPTPE